MLYAVHRKRERGKRAVPMKENISGAHSNSRFLNGLKLLFVALVLYIALYGAYFYFTVYDDMVISEDSFATNDKYTMRINTFRRNDDLKVIIDHFTRCPHIDSIQVIWSDLENSPPPLSFFELSKNNKVPVLFEIHSINSLNSRFNPILPINTDAVYSTDDDVLIDCDVMTLAFKIWLNSKAPMLGFSRRLHGRDPSTGHYHYLYKEHVHVRGAYSMILTKNAFLDKSLMKIYMDPSFSELHKYVDDHRNCEDVLMSFVAANITHRPSIYYYTPVKDLGKKGGISSGGTHKSIRDGCLDKFVSFFGHDPLITTTYEAKPVDKYWIKLPGFWI